MVRRTQSESAFQPLLAIEKIMIVLSVLKCWHAFFITLVSITSIFLQTEMLKKTPMITICFAISRSQVSYYKNFFLLCVHVNTSFLNIHQIKMRISTSKEKAVLKKMVTKFLSFDQFCRILAKKYDSKFSCFLIWTIHQRSFPVWIRNIISKRY